MRYKKALVLLSGGLDSILAAKLLLEQKVQVKALIFKSYFFDEKKGKKAARLLKIPYRVIDFSRKHLKMVKNPPHGYGKAANPCLDCHLLMLREAKKIMKEQNYNFVATGEVLGERPFSQNKKALLLLAKKSGLGDRLLRPLSAKLLSPTLPEKKGWINRKKLSDIQGRSRKKQIKLAKKYKITGYPQPAGGCLLCEKKFGKKLLKMFEKWPECQGEDIALLKFGRHFWESESLIILGRNQEENEKLTKLAKKGDIFIKPQNFPGPSALIRGEKAEKKLIAKTQIFILEFSKKTKTKPSFSLFYL